MSEKKNGVRRMTYEELHDFAMEQKSRADELQKKLDDTEAKFIDAVRYSCPEKYMKIFHDHKIQSPEDLDFKLDKLKRMEDQVLYLRGARKDLTCLVELLHMGAELYVAR